MRIHHGIAAIFGGLVAAAAALPADTAADASTPQNCKAITFTVNGTAQNKNITAGIVAGTLDELRQAFDAAPFITVSGPQTIAATYCTPLVKNSNNDKIQMLYGSITAAREGWQALGGVGTDFPAYNPNFYSWTLFANRLGYATLAIDRLGNGKSSHPDGLLVVQAPYEEALYNNLAMQIRAGAKQIGRAYNFLIYVGNSYGSQLGAGIAGAYPKAYNQFILTGFSYAVDADFLGVSMINPLPAATVNPARFGNLSAEYLTASSEVGRTNSFFGSKQQVSFEDQVAHLFFVREDVVSLGQFVSVYAGTFNGTGFTGRVLVLTGEQDQAFCGPGSPVIGPASCGPLLKQAGSGFPNADYNYQSVNRTGHAIQVHLSAQKVFTIAHSFLAGASFKGGPPA